MPSRGCSPSQLVQSKWWLGPTWLYKPASDWPTTIENCDEKEIGREAKKTVSVHIISTETSTFKPYDYFSSYNKLLRFLAWMHRFLLNRRKEIERKNNTRGKRTISQVYLSETERKKLCLTVAKIEAAEIKLLKYLQEQMFANTSKGKLASFKIMKNKDELLVLKTKILNRDDFNFLCPILLDSNNDIIHMMIREIHESLGHAGTQMMNYAREKYWIISIRKVAKLIIAKCVICQRQRVKRLESDPPPLPLNRICDASIFEIVGIDFAGPPIFARGREGMDMHFYVCRIPGGPF